MGDPLIFTCERCGSRTYRLQSDGICPLCNKRVCSNCWCCITETCEECALPECEICGELHPLSRMSTCEGCGRYPVHDECMIEDDICETCAWGCIDDNITAILIKHKLDLGYRDEVFNWLTGVLYMSSRDCWDANISKLTEEWIRDVFASEPENVNAIVGKITWLVAQ